MISDTTLMLWFRNKLNDDGTIDLDSVAWENRQFDSSGLDVFYQERYEVIQERVSSRTEMSKWGTIFYDVIVDKGSGTNEQNQKAELIADIFDPRNNKDVEIEAGLKIDIDEATTGTRTVFDENRNQLPVRIHFRAYETN